MAEVLPEYVGRLAPSPTGALHLGNVRTFMAAWLRARSQGGKVIMRMEDLDHPRDKAGADKAAKEDLKWLGFDWDGEYVQSERKEKYKAALEVLKAKDLVYPCTCKRKDVLAAQSAPHEGEQLYYGGACRGKYRSWVEGACWRFKAPEGAEVEFEDAFCGKFRQKTWEKLGDFPIARDESGAGYTLAVVVDDADMGVTEVVRGDDLLAATPAQILISRALGLREIKYCHLPLLVGEDGRRLAKRHGDSRIGHYRARGVKAEEILGHLAYWSGWIGKDTPVSLKELIGEFSLEKTKREPCIFRQNMI